MPKSSTTKKARRDIYQEVTDKMITALERGTVPWRQPWAAGSLPLSMSTRRPYRGINVFILDITAQLEGYDSPWWGTYKQITERGGQVRKGEKSTMVILWRPVEKEDAAGNVVERFMVLRAYNVFNECQAEWAEGARRPVTPNAPEGSNPIDACDALVATYLANGPKLGHGGEHAYYKPSTDQVQMPARASFHGDEAYYSALFHELTHSTGAERRLNRPGIAEHGHRFGDVVYSAEELVAEMGATMMCGLAGIDQMTFENSAAYIASWIKVFQDDPQAIVKAGAAAQRAVDLATSATFEDAATSEEEVAA
jgi:antirestriction protein ArdC